MAGEITTAMLSELGLRLEDAEQQRFTKEFKLTALNRAQVQLANMLHNGYLTELETNEDIPDISTPEGEIALTALNEGDGVLRGGEGILKLSVNAGGNGGGIWAHELGLQYVKRAENTFLAGSDSNPLYYVYGSKIVVLMTTYEATTAQVYFLKMPATMSESVDPELNEALYGLILSLAEAICWAMDAKFDRRTSAINGAYEEIKILNERYTAPEGIGTNNSRRQIIAPAQ